MGSPSGSAWTAGQVAKHLGIAESTLRSWHRRYGIGPQGSEPGRYRRYGEDDVARLRRMLDLIGLGMLASDAARTVQAGDSEPVTAERDVAAVVAAARASDAERCRIVLDSALARRGVIAAWDEVCRPALAAIDADQRTDPDCIDIEHGLSWALLGACTGPRGRPSRRARRWCCSPASRRSTIPSRSRRCPRRSPPAGYRRACWAPRPRRRAWSGRYGTPRRGPWCCGRSGRTPPPRTPCRPLLATPVQVYTAGPAGPPGHPRTSGTWKASRMRSTCWPGRHRAPLRRTAPGPAGRVPPRRRGSRARSPRRSLRSRPALSGTVSVFPASRIVPIWFCSVTSVTSCAH